MSCTSCRFGGIAAVVSSLWFVSAVSSLAATTNNWTNTVSSVWMAATNWSAATPPSSSFDYILITNAGTKTVTIDAGTPPVNLDIRSLTVSAPNGSTNTLRLVDVPLGTPITTSKPLLVGTNGVLHIVNSAVSAADTFDIASGEFRLDSGGLDCALNCDLQSGRLLVNGGALTAMVGGTGIRMGRYSGANANLTISNGTVNILRLTLGSVGGSQNSLTIAGGTLLCAETFSMAQLPATTGNVTMTGGNLIVTNGTTRIADRAAATFSQSGGSSVFTELIIGNLGLGIFNLSGGQMTVTPRTDIDLTIVGNVENGEFNQSGGVAFIRGELHVADFAGVTGALNISGGQFFATNGLVAIGRHGFGSLTVSNATAVVTNVSVGRHDTAIGSLILENNGSFFAIDDISVGRFTNSEGHVLVTGGLLSLTNDYLWVGREGIGDLTVSNGTVRARGMFVGMSPDTTNSPQGTVLLAGGSIHVTSNLVVGSSQLSTGSVSVVGGNLTITNSGNNAYLKVDEGLLTLDLGTITTDKLLLTNVDGQFVFNGGTLQAKSITASNGAPFVIGDGVNSATLQLQGGTYSFANGLVISSNATVTGCGTIIGPITNNGTLATNCSPVITITAINKTNDSVTVSFTTSSGANHLLEYNTNLVSTNWSAILPGVTGNGSVMSKTDSSATNASRFYRIHLQ